MVFRRFRRRLLLIGLAIAGASALIQRFDPGHRPTFADGLYFTWSLLFGQTPDDLPAHPALRVLVFALPVVGLTVVIHAIVDLSDMMRDRRRHERSWCTMMASSLSNHIILVGLGKLGYRTFLMLRKLGEVVVVIESNERNPFLDEIRRDGCPLLLGDARRDAILLEANVAAARSVILATNDDLANLEVSLDARRFNPQIRVVLRMFDQNMADKIRDGFNIHIAMSQSAISAPGFALAALDPALTHSYMLDDQLIVTRRTAVAAGGPLAGMTVGEVLAKHGFAVVRHCPSGERAALFPKPDVRLNVGDEVMVQGPFDGLARIGVSIAA